MTDKPWLGAQEAQYASLLWHLDVPDGYTSQVDATRSVFPGKAMVNVNSSPISHAQVQIKGFAEAWITDMECATSLKPKMYGFDFARVTEVYKKDGERRLVVEEDQATRAGMSGLSEERAMMKDLILSTMREGGEICMSYHMLNPFASQQADVKGDQIGDMLSFGVGGNINLGSTNLADDSAPNVAAARRIIDNNARLLGEFLSEVLASPHSNGKNIWLRLLHEPNVNHFWWGHPAGGASTGNFYQNYMKLWNHLVEKIKLAVADEHQSRVKFVFCMNGESDLAGFNDKLDLYFPDLVSPTFASDYARYINSITILGLDYYEDWENEWNETGLKDQYAALVTKMGAINGRFGVTWQHALTEVSVRSVGKFKGKLYGAYDGVPAWPENATIDGESVLNRQFFDKVVYPLVREHDPKWVLFWINRVGNSILSSFEPTTGAAANGEPEVFYDARTNVFSSHYVQHFFPIFPAEPFVVETFKAGDDSGAKTFFPISQTDQIPNLPGGGAGADLANHVNPYKDAILDFFQMVPPLRRTANTAMARAVEQFLCDPDLPRPVIDPAPTAAQRAELLFEVL